MKSEYIYRQIVKETSKAYLVEVTYSNRRDGWGIKRKWIAKSICGETKDCWLGKFVEVPTSVIGNGIW